MNLMQDSTPSNLKSMKVYTKGGDQGDTGLYGGARVPKDDLRIRVYGTLDEVNSVMGLLLSVPSSSKLMPAQTVAFLKELQGKLFQLGSELATPRGKAVASVLVSDGDVKALESAIDAMDAQLKPLKTFILPGGSSAAAWTHLARTVSRRAERELITLNRAEPVRPIVLQFFNRLSDYFFVLARFFNHCAQVEDTPWVASASGP